jgi:uncharacterized protein
MNRLSSSTSPYLKQHADNPVDWYPWGEEALERAKKEDKPVFLSVGYSACHWCHVMAHESFEHQDVADLLNEHFISIKIDREEFPDLDAFYMTATSIITQRGGWPNSVWLTPDGRPWYAGTYFPREDQPGRIGFKSLLVKLAELWKNEREAIEEQADKLTAAIGDNNQAMHDPALDHMGIEEWVSHARQTLMKSFDSRFAGFGQAPKFPPHNVLLFLLDSLELDPSPEATTMIQTTLDAMARGGIHDHIGGGFHRYATDERWKLPHFEKMLYDNALLLKAYSLAAVRFNNEEYREVALGIAGWLMREMTHPEGGFYAALDADSEGEEGRFYTWTMDELKEILDGDELKEFCYWYQIEPGGNFHDEATGHITGRNIPVLRLDASGEQIKALAGARKKLLAAREKRVRPGLDDKIITAWNGLMISALAVAYTLLNEGQLFDAAIRARDYLAKHLHKKGRVLRCRCGEKTSPQEGRLEDYAALTMANLELYEATARMEFLDTAEKIAKRLLKTFYDKKSGDLFMIPAGDALAGIRMRDIADAGSASGTGLTVQALVKLVDHLQDEEMTEAAYKMFSQVNQFMHRAPQMSASILHGMLLYEMDVDFEYDTDEEILAALLGPGEVDFSLDPPVVAFSREGRGHATLRLQLPDGWYLNELMSRAGGASHAIAMNWSAPAPPVNIEFKEAGPGAWNITLVKKTPDDPLLGRFTLNVTYQLCTDLECREKETAMVDVQLR